MIKKFIFILALLTASAAVPPSVITSAFVAGVYTMTNGQKVGYLRLLPPGAAGHTGRRQADDELPAACIFLHGIDQVYSGSANGGQYDTTGVYDDNYSTSGKGTKWLITKAAPFLFRFGSPFFQPPGTGSVIASRVRMAMFAPQCRTGDNWATIYIQGMINEIKANYANDVDTNKIWVYGYSLGGIGGKNAIADKFCRDNLSCVYLQSPGPTNSSDFAGAADDGLPIAMLHNDQDKVATTSQNWAIPFIQSMNAQSPEWPVQFWYVTSNNTTWFDTDLHGSWKWTNDTTRPIVYAPPLVSGGTLVLPYLIPWEWALQFKKQRIHR